MKNKYFLFILIMSGLLIGVSHPILGKGSAALIERNHITIVALESSADNKWMALELEPSSIAEQFPDSFVQLIPNEGKSNYAVNAANIVTQGKSFLREVPIGWRNNRSFIVARFSDHDKRNNLVKLIEISVPEMQQETLAEFVSAKTLFQQQSENNGSIENFTLHADCDELWFTRNIQNDADIKDILSPSDSANWLTSSFQRVYKFNLKSKQITAVGDLPPSYRCSDISNKCATASDGSTLQVIATPMKSPSGNRACAFSFQDNKFVKSKFCSQGVAAQGTFSPDDSKVAFLLPSIGKGLSAPGKVQIIAMEKSRKGEICDTLSSMQHVEWNPNNNNILTYSLFDDNPVVSVIGYRDTSTQNIALPWKDDFVAIWSKNEANNILLGRKNEVWKIDVTSKKKKLLFKVLLKD